MKNVNAYMKKSKVLESNTCKKKKAGKTVKIFFFSLSLSELIKLPAAEGLELDGISLV